MSELRIFENPSFGSIRTDVDENGKVLFCGTDVASALGYTNPRKAVRDHTKGGTKRSIGVQTGQRADGTAAMQMVEMLFIPEGDVYRLIVHSRLPAAEQFEHWVFDEVLPSIRMRGAYMTAETARRIVTDPEFLTSLAEAFQSVKSRADALQQQVGALEAKAEEQQRVMDDMRPKAAYCDVVLSCPDLVSVSVIAKDYGWTAQRMNQYLHSLGIQYRSGSVWLLYRQYAGEGYTQTRTYTETRFDGTTRSSTITSWTQKGRLFIYETLKREGVLPLIERCESSQDDRAAS